MFTLGKRHERWNIDIFDRQHSFRFLALDFVPLDDVVLIGQPSHHLHTAEQQSVECLRLLTGDRPRGKRKTMRQRKEALLDTSRP